MQALSFWSRQSTLRRKFADRNISDSKISKLEGYPRDKYDIGSVSFKASQSLFFFLGQNLRR